MADDAEKKEGEALPPRLDLRKQMGMKGKPPEASAASPNAEAAEASPTPAARKPVTPTVPRIVTVPGAPRPIAGVQSRPAEIQPTAPETKEATARIPLEAAAPPPAEAAAAGSGGPATVRVKPATVDLKRKTSRIPLEAALGAREEAGQTAPSPAAPKTIRLKRPNEAETVKLAQPQAAETAAVKETARKTSRIEAEAPPPEEGTPTRRKTIVVKRPTQRAAMRAPAISRAAGGEGVPLELLEAEAPEPETGAGWIVACVAASLAIVVSFMVIWMLAAQACGTNISLTKLSSVAPGLDLPWPGKIAPGR